MRITNDLAAAYVLCPYKAMHRLQGEIGEQSDYSNLQDEFEGAYRKIAIERLCQQYKPSQITSNELIGSDGFVSRHRLKLNVGYSDPSYEWLFQAIEITPIDTRIAKRELVPIRFSHSAQMTQHLKLQAAIDAVVLSEIQELPVQSARIIYGPNFDATKVKLTGPSGPTNLASQARQSLSELESLIANKTAKLLLNRHCDVCGFRKLCHEEAVNKDDLSLLKGLSKKEIDTLNERGIFTVTQLTHTFRAKSMSRSTAKPKRHSMPLQAKAIKDNIVYIRKKPELPPGATRIYFDAEGVPESDSYYLIGMLIENEDGCTQRHFLGRFTR